MILHPLNEPTYLLSFFFFFCYLKMSINWYCVFEYIYSYLNKHIHRKSKTNIIKSATAWMKADDGRERTPFDRLTNKGNPVSPVCPKWHLMLLWCCYSGERMSTQEGSAKNKIFSEPFQFKPNIWRAWNTSKQCRVTAHGSASIGTGI